MTSLRPESAGASQAQPRSRFVGSWPKIGLRPTIDGRRRGVRESLEAQTLSMARATAELISAELRYPDGTPGVCVIPDSCIGGVVEAAEAADLFRREGVGVSITVTPCWCYGSETMDMDPLMPKAVWGLNGTERPGAVYLAAVFFALRQNGLPALWIYGRDVPGARDSPFSPDASGELLRFRPGGLSR